MSASAAVARSAAGRLGVMVRTHREIFAYWSIAADRPLLLRVTDLTGRPASELLDGTGGRDVPIAPAQREAYIGNLLPGHLYVVELGETEAGAFYPLVTAGPVQTPWTPTGDASHFPSPYHRS